MMVDRDNLFFEIDDKEECDEELIIAALLEDGVLFCNTRKYVCPFSKEEQPETIVLFVNCNDTFALGGGDAEPITTDELSGLYKLHHESPMWGSTKWVCKKRNLKPHQYRIKQMKKDGVWDDMMESLPEIVNIKE